MIVSKPSARNQMSSTIFTTASDKAYVNLGVKPAGQRWFAFDVVMGEARQGRAAKFVMTVWNYHTLTKSTSFQTWAITRDTDTGTYWYRVSRERDGNESMNRKSLWDALHIAYLQGMPMHAMLKDGKTHQCAPDYVFQITNVRQEDDASALWLKLEVHDDRVGTEVEQRQLPPMQEIKASIPSDSARSSSLTKAQYRAARESASSVHFGETNRSDAIAFLNEQHGINVNSASALINNYRCLALGIPIKAPMSAEAMRSFIDSVVARLGASAIPNVIAALEGYVTYAANQWGNTSAAMNEMLSDMHAELKQESVLQAMADTATSVTSLSPQLIDVASEMLREIWVRGPQHAAFRRELLRRWNSTCSVHGASCNGQLRASHIVAWRLDELVRGDVNNGLLLSVPLDNLFDRGLITFSDDGLLTRSHLLQADTAMHFGLKPGLRIAWNHLPENARIAIRLNLAKHREVHKELGPHV